MQKLILLTCLVSGVAWSQSSANYYLSEKDQKYFKNDAMEGNNQFERINMNVKEINKLHSDMASLKAEVQVLKKEIEELKKGK